MDTYVIVGAGPVGTETAQLLRDRGDRVVVVSRSGSGPVIDGIEPITADASDADALAEITDGATALFNCANPRNYTQWAAVWPPLAGSLLSAAERTGATLVTASSLYGYGPVDGPMLEGMPDAATDKKGKIRAGMWAEAKARHDAGRLRAVEVRASDYVGARVGANGHITRHLPTAKHGKSAWVIGNPDLPHSWTDVRDVGRTLVAVATQADTWGQVWHAPSNPARSQRGTDRRTGRGRQAPGGGPRHPARHHGAGWCGIAVGTRAERHGVRLSPTVRGVGAADPRSSRSGTDAVGRGLPPHRRRQLNERARRRAGGASAGRVPSSSDRRRAAPLRRA